MKVAFAIWNNRIAPVFDTAGEVLVVEAVNGKLTDEFSTRISVSSVLEKTEQLKSVGVETLVCGAVSRTAQAQVEARGIKVVPFISGEVRDVVQAWQSNEIERDVYAMPGCCRRHRGVGCGRNFRRGAGGGGRRGRGHLDY